MSDRILFSRVPDKSFHEAGEGSPAPSLPLLEYPVNDSLGTDSPQKHKNGKGLIPTLSLGITLANLKQTADAANHQEPKEAGFLCPWTKSTDHH